MPAKKRKDELSLIRVILVVSLLAGIVLLVLKAVQWYQVEYIGQSMSASATAQLDEALVLADQGDTEQAIQKLLPLVERLRDETLTPRALMLLASLHQKQGDILAAEKALEQSRTLFPNNPEWPLVDTAYARILETTGRTEEAAALYEQIDSLAPSELRAGALSGLARLAATAGDLVKARDLYAEAVSLVPWGSDPWLAGVKPLGEANVNLVFSPVATPESRVYEVASGDTLTAIGNKLNTTQGMLEKANNMSDTHALRIGQRLKYTPKDFRIVIERSTKRLYLLDKNGIFKMYTTGLGRPGNETTLGSYKIGDKQKDPAWFKPGEGMIPPGDPRNELGTRWMPMVPVEEGLPTDLGIHGTINPDTIGDYSSSGCARMLREDVEELYDLVVRSTPVDVVEVFDPAAP
jgi:lipoprotein-anchoring transpeptidase ErfK/SrfK/predicted negative regulator of RcsB-dependent stress response